MQVEKGRKNTVSLQECLAIPVFLDTLEYLVEIHPKIQSLDLSSALSLQGINKNPPIWANSYIWDYVFQSFSCVVFYIIYRYGTTSFAPQLIMPLIHSSSDLWISMGWMKYSTSWEACPSADKIFTCHIDNWNLRTGIQFPDSSLSLNSFIFRVVGYT